MYLSVRNGFAFWGARGTFAATLYADTTYNLTLSKSVTPHLAGSFVTNTGITGYVIVEEATLKITPHETIQNGSWVLASALLVAGL